METFYVDNEIGWTVLQVTWKSYIYFLGTILGFIGDDNISEVMRKLDLIK